MTTAKKMAYLIAGAGVVFVLYFGWALASRSAYESAAYDLIRSDGQFEVREYSDLVLATTETRFEAQGNDGSFGRLFDYISGDNESNQKVAMTTPVFMEPESENQPGQMGFVVPACICCFHRSASSIACQCRTAKSGRRAVCCDSLQRSAQCFDSPRC